ncbi:hypothetical protein YC2023_089280 [Brassica napus]
MNSRSSKSESKINQVFVGQQKMDVYFDWNIGSIYSELTKKFKSLSDHVNMLDNQERLNDVEESKTPQPDNEDEEEPKFFECVD